MFNLDDEIHAWCRSVFPTGWNRNERIDELKDHISCEIERLREQGMSEEQAYFAATRQMGEINELRKEYSKNRSLFSLLLTEWKSPMTSKKVAVLHIVVALVFAVVMVVTDYVVEQTSYAHLSQSITEWLVIIYMIPFLFLCSFEERCSCLSKLSVVKRYISSQLKRG